MPVPTQPQRIHIIGGPGTGKTYLSSRAGRRLGLPVYEMDAMADARQFTWDVVADRRAWITEGIFLWAIDELLESAQVIVWLDLPYRTALRRIIVRHAWLSLRGRNRYKGLRRLGRFAWGIRAYWTRAPREPVGPTDWDALTRAQTINILRPHRHKLVRCGSRREAMTWLAAVSGLPPRQQPKETRA